MLLDRAALFGCAAPLDRPVPFDCAVHLDCAVPLARRGLLEHFAVAGREVLADGRRA